jgi:hypothetical protein
MRSLVRPILVAGLSWALASCGGGGGGGEGGGGGGGSSGTLTLSTNTLTFSATGTSATPSGQIVTATVTGASGGTLVVRVVATGPAVGSISGVTITGPTSGRATVFPASASALGVGTFASTITVTACLNDVNCSGPVIGTPQTINVTYTIPGVASSVASLSYSLGNTPLPGDFSRQLNVTGYPTQNWSVASNLPWLTPTPPNGSAASSVQVTAPLDQTQVGLLNNGTYTGSVTLTPTSGDAVTIPVSLTIARTQVNYVAPYIATTNTSNEVIIRGENLDQVTISGVTFGGNSATAFNRVSATEIHATHPVLTPAGPYPVQLQTNLPSVRSLATLVAVDPPTFPGTLAYPNATAKRVIDLAYDAERKALLVGIVYPSLGLGANELVRYVFTTGWDAGTTKAFPNLSGLALSTDGQQLLLGSELPVTSELAITQINPLTLASGTVTTAGRIGETFQGLGVTNDGFVVVAAHEDGGFAPAFRYSIRNPGFTTLTGVGFQGFGFFRANGAASADGSRVVMGSVLDFQDLWVYDASTETASDTSVGKDAISLSLSRTGSRLLLNGTALYDGAFVLQGGALPATTLASVLSSDGTHAYSYDSDGKVHAFDLAGTPVAGIYPESATAVAVSDPGPGINGSDMRMLITPDGGTLFLAGSTQVVIVPTP